VRGREETFLPVCVSTKESKAQYPVYYLFCLIFSLLQNSLDTNFYKEKEKNLETMYPKNFSNEKVGI